MDIVIDKP